MRMRCGVATRCATITMVLFLSACSTPEQPAPPVYSGPIETITGVEPHYEAYSPSNNQDYVVNGQRYQIVQDPQNFSQKGLASWYGDEYQGKLTATGEPFEPYALAAAHPTLPIPSYVRVTNLNNGRRLVVRVNDRGPFVEGKIIELTKTAAERLNLTSRSPVQVDFIQVSADGTLSGPGSVGTEIVQQTFSLPDRPNIGGAAISMSPAASPPPAAVATSPADTRAPALIHSSPSTVATETAAEGFMVQVGALSDAARAQHWQQTLSQQFGVPGTIRQNGSLYRVQLGPFGDQQQAQALQQRLQAEAQQQSFIIAPH